MSTIRRDKVRRLVEAGRIHLTGSYHYDDMTGEERSQGKSVPCAIMPEKIEDRQKLRMDGSTCYLYASDFTSSSGHASVSDDGTRITLYVHSNCNYDLRVLPAATPTKEKA